MKLFAIIEVIRIKQEVREEMVALEHAIIHSPESARQIGSSFILKQSFQALSVRLFSSISIQVGNSELDDSQ